MITRRHFLKILSGSPVLLYFNSCAPTEKISHIKRKLLYSFIFSNDIHATTDEHAQYFAQSIQNWNSFSHLYDFVVICGDLVNYGLSEELKKMRDQLALLKKPYYPVVGNHDVAGPGEDGKMGYREVFGLKRENYVIMHKETALVFLDLTEGMSAQVKIKEHTIQWLQTTLQNTPKKMPIIVFSHFPLHPDTPRFPVKKSSDLFAILDKRKVLAYFSGHYHAKWQGIRNDVDFIGNTCMSLKRDNHDGTPEEGYMLVNVYNSGVETQFFKRGTSPEFINKVEILE